MTPILSKLRTSDATRQFVRFFTSIALALAILYLVRFELTFLAVIIALTSKWQVLLGGPRLWPYNLWDNAVDIIFILSIITLLHLYHVTGLADMQLGVIGLYLAWQILIKPLSGVSGHAIQSLVMLAVAVSVIFIMKLTIGVFGILVLSWIVAAAAADHFLISITDEVSLRRLLVGVWSLIVLQVSWILSRWLVFYPFMDGQIVIPQAALLIVAMGYVFGIIYYDHHKKVLSRRRLYLYIGLLFLITIILVVGSEWVHQL